MALSKGKVNLKILRENLLKYEQEQQTKPIILDDKVDEFINWYTENMVKGNYSDIGEFHKPNDMRNFIEKMAVWYELRYPDYVINRLMPGSGQEMIDINDVMFRKNWYTNDLLDEDSDVRDLDWDQFYNTKAFINSLPWSERWLLQEPKYRDIVYWNCHHRSSHLHLSAKGIITEAELMENITGIPDENLRGINIKTLVEELKNNGIEIPIESELENAIKEYDNRIYQKEEMLNCVMYRIIERGGNRFGPRRAFQFAKEFGRNIDIPMIYGVDRSDPGLRSFMNEYLKAGGSKDLVCYSGYFSRSSKYEKLEIITLQELIQTTWNDCVTKYTPEEDELHQRLVNAIANLINQEELAKEPEGLRSEETKQLQLQRKR